MQVFDDSIVGKDLEALCSKCGESWHVVVAVSDGRIAEVECKSCGGRHKYRPVHKDRLTVKTNTKTSIAVGTSSREALKKPTGEKRASKAKVEAEPVAIIPRVEHNGGETKEYSIRATDFLVGDRIIHKSFGVGIVEEVNTSLKKMTVAFSTERLQLVFGK